LVIVFGNSFAAFLCDDDNYEEYNRITGDNPFYKYYEIPFIREKSVQQEKSFKNTLI